MTQCVDVMESNITNLLIILVKRVRDKLNWVYVMHFEIWTFDEFNRNLNCCVTAINTYTFISFFLYFFQLNVLSITTVISFKLIKV